MPSGSVQPSIRESGLLQTFQTRIQESGLKAYRHRQQSVNSGPMADLTPFADLSSDEWHKGVVARTAPFGAFVTVTLDDGSSADGLVHVSKIKDSHGICMEL